MSVPSRGCFDDALRLHQEGHIEEADAAYQEVLAAQPNHPGGLHLLGVIRQQQGRHREAVELIGRAIEVNPAKAVYRNNYGAALLSLDRLEEAEASFRRALEICPRYSDALANLGIVQTLREEEAAEASFRRALEIQPRHRDATTRLAAFLGKRGRDAEAPASSWKRPSPRRHAATFTRLWEICSSAWACPKGRGTVPRGARAESGRCDHAFQSGAGVRGVARYGRVRGDILPRRPNCGRRNGCGGCGRSFAARWSSRSGRRLKSIARGWRGVGRGGRLISPHPRPLSRRAEGSHPTPQPDEVGNLSYRSRGEG